MKLLNKKAVILELKAKTKKTALKEIATHLEKNKFITSSEKYLEALLKRESQFSTGIGNEIGIPHAQSDVVQENVVLIAKSTNGIDWDSADKKKVKYIFSIALNSKDADLQVDTLQELSRSLMNEETKKRLESAKNEEDLMKSLIDKKVEKVAKTGSKKVVAITACPTGIAHTYMAADMLEKASAELGYSAKIEKQGRKIENALSQSDIDNADVIILAIDKGIEGINRFKGKKVLKVGTKSVIKDAKEVINNYDSKGEMMKGSKANKEEDTMSDYSWSAFKNVYKNLMGGVSRMLPFVVAGGIILGIAFLLDTGNSGGNLGVTRDIARWFSGLGKLGLGIFVPILGAYVAYSIVGPEGLLPGMIAGLIASGGGLLYGGAATGWSNLWGGLTPGIDQSVLSGGSGFIGAMVGGYLAAAMVVTLRKYVFKNVNNTFRGAVDIVAMPIFSVLMTGVGMFVIQIPLAYFAYGLKLGLEGLADRGLIVLLTFIIGLMMAFDMGGPVNKVAYVFGTGLIGLANPTEADYIVMGSVMVAGMVPPLGIALSTLIFRSKAWSASEIESSRANWLLGLFFITEGAIPFAAKDPKRVIPSIMIGSAIAGLLTGLFKIGVSAPHGGIIVASLFKSYLFTTEGMRIGMGVTLMLSSLIAGMVSTALILGFWRSKDVKNGKLILV